MRHCVLSHFGSKEHGRAFASVGPLAAEVLKSVRAMVKTAVCESVVSSAAASEEDNFISNFCLYVVL